jgi:hypothetical protein
VEAYAAGKIQLEVPKSKTPGIHVRGACREHSYTALTVDEISCMLDPHNQSFLLGFRQAVGRSEVQLPTSGELKEQRRLTAVKRGADQFGGATAWDCLCDCGKNHHCNAGQFRPRHGIVVEKLAFPPLGSQ